MLEIKCPWCGPRAEIEFAYGGEGGVVRPVNSEQMSDEQWGDYVFMRDNPKGLHHEQWRHASGCGRWFNALRDTVTYRIHATWKVGENMPALNAGDKVGARRDTVSYRIHATGKIDENMPTVNAGDKQ